MGKELDFEEEMRKIIDGSDQGESQLKPKDKELLKHFTLGFFCGMMWNKRFGKNKADENLHERN
ncbi:MAG: hypothetical protein ACFFCE_01655 [Promethearchaeota archaeon]